MFSINDSRTADGCICGGRMPVKDRAAGGLELGIL